MIYAYDKAALFPVAELYDTLMMAMAINAAKDMYEKGQDEIKDFTKTYGDFMSPFAKDMERYGEMVGGVRDTINKMYAAGIDPLRSAEGRAMLSRLTNSINPAEFNMMRANAKTGYAYLDAIQDLRRKGKYSEAQELFDIMQTGGLGTDSEGNSINTFENFSTAGRGGWNSFTRTSPIEATSLLDLTYNHYKNRTARDLTPEDLAAANIPYDKRYQYTGYLDSDLMKVAPGAALALLGDPRAAFFRNLAELKVAALGRPYTLADVDAQFYRDIADANKWALIDPTKKVDEYAKMAQEHAYQVDLLNKKGAIDKEIAGIKSGNVEQGYGGGYLLGLAIDAKGQKNGTMLSVLANNPKLQQLMKTIQKIKDPVQRSLSMNTLNTNLMVSFLNSKAHGTGNTIYKMLMSLNDGNGGAAGRDIVNNVLSNFATNSNERLNREVVLESYGFEAGDQPGTYRLPTGVSVVSPHQLLKNIIAYGAGDFEHKKDILTALQNNEESRNEVDWWPDFFGAKTSSIANRTDIIKPTGSKKGVIVAPNENGVETLYMKVKTISDSMFDGDHNGFWVEIGPTYGPGGITSDNTPLILGSEEIEGKLFGNSQRKEAFENRRD